MNDAMPPKQASDVLWDNIRNDDPGAEMLRMVFDVYYLMCAV